MINSKNKLFVYGACDLLDVVKSDLLRRDFDVIDFAVDRSIIDNSRLEFNTMSFPDAGTSVISMYTKPGPIAQRALETFETLSKRDKLLYSSTFKEILKFPYLDFYRKHAGPNDYIVISFSAELYTKLLCVSECFSCLPSMNHMFDKNNCLHWLYSDYLSKEEYLLPFDTKESLEWSFDVMVDFARDIQSIFQDRVILVKTHFSNLAISNSLEVVKIKPSPDDLLFYRQTKVVSDATDHNYAERLSEIIMNKFKHHYSFDLPVIRLAEPVFLDANHSWGLSQFHIDSNSRQKIAKRIHEKILKHSITTKNEQTS